MASRELPRSLATQLIRAYDWFDDALLHRMHAAGYTEMTRAQSTIYSYLDAAGSRPADLARRVGVSRQAMHKTLGEMVDLGLITLEPDPTDQRAKLAVATERGEATRTLAREVLAELEQQLESRIGQDSMQGLRDALAMDWGAPPLEGPGNQEQ